MRQPSLVAVTALATIATATSLADVCTVANVQAALPANGTLLGINLLPSTVTASPLYNVSSGTGSSLKKRQSDNSTSTSSTTSYCNVTVSYARPGKTNVDLLLAFPAPSDFENRWYVAGGGGFSLSNSATGGLTYGAVGGATSAGYDSFDYEYNAVALYGNGSVNWDATYMFAYQALGEMTTVGKAITNAFYGISDDTKVFSYFEGCSDGGREGMSQVQRWAEEYDGVIAGAPAFRFAQQQITHLLSPVVEQTLDYYPPPCEMTQIVTSIIEACDPLDGKTDGIISRTDLCKLNFNISSLIGTSYYCAASSGSTGPGKRETSSGSTPEQNGTVTAQGVAIAEAIYAGIHNSEGEQAYLAWQIGSQLADAETTYDSTTDSWVYQIPSIGGQFAAIFVELLDIDTLPNLDNVTYDTLVEWIDVGMQRYYDSLQTTVPDLTPFQSAGGKLLHYHGESDPSIPSGSSVHYWQSVQSIMYPNDTYTEEESLEALQDWYQFYLVPGGAHCGANSLQPGTWPADNMQTMIDWVESGIRPSRLNSTATSGVYAGETIQLCQWPTRPLYIDNTTTFDCVNSTESIESWTYTFPAIKFPTY